MISGAAVTLTFLNCVEKEPDTRVSNSSLYFRFSLAIVITAAHDDYKDDRAVAFTAAVTAIHIHALMFATEEQLQLPALSAASIEICAAREQFRELQAFLASYPFGFVIKSGTNFMYFPIVCFLEDPGIFCMFSKSLRCGL